MQYLGCDVGVPVDIYCRDRRLVAEDEPVALPGASDWVVGAAFPGTFGRDGVLVE